MPTPEERPHSRATDVDKTQEIEALILEEEDRRMRMLALVVQSLNTNIRDLTLELREDRKIADEYRQKLDAHLTDYSTTMNTRKGIRMALGWGWKFFAGIGVAVQALFLSVGSYYMHKLDNVAVAVQQNEVQHAQIDGRLQKVESDIGRISK